MLQISNAGSTPLNSKELIEKYPSIGQNSKRPENKKILCPYLRLIERSGLFDSEKLKSEPELIVSLRKLLNGVKDFGLRYFAGKTAATVVSIGQSTSGTSKLGKVNLHSLHTAKVIAHECGLTFGYKEITINTNVRKNTLNRLKAISIDGKLSLENMLTIKKEICVAQGVKESFAGMGEVLLIFKFLGGDNNGFVYYNDVELFLNSYMPMTKSKGYFF
jgi:hypothetical protein